MYSEKDFKEICNLLLIDRYPNIAETIRSCNFNEEKIRDHFTKELEKNQLIEFKINPTSIVKSTVLESLYCSYEKIPLLIGEYINFPKTILLWRLKKGV